MSQTAEAKLYQDKNTELETQVDDIFTGGNDLIAGIPGDKFVKQAIADRLLRGIGGIVEMMDAFNVSKDGNGKMWVLAKLKSPDGVTDRSLFIDNNYRGGFGSPELSEECNTALGAIAIGHDERGESYYDSNFYKNV